MRLHRIEVQNFRNLKNCSVDFLDATFLIGPNNTGKSSLFKALDHLHSSAALTRDDHHKSYDPDTDAYVYESEIEIIAEYRNLPEESENWQGFRGRVLTVENQIPGETNLAIRYKKIWSINKTKPEIYLQEYPRSIAPEYSEAKKVQDLIGNHYDEQFIRDHFGDSNLAKNLTVAAMSQKLQDLPAYWDIDNTGEIKWIQNPGGIPGNVLSKLPQIIVIPAESCITELTSSGGSLHKMLGNLFTHVREKSDNFKQAQGFLNELAKELDPSDQSTDFGQLIESLNSMTHRLFPDSSVHVSASLDQPDKAIKPQFSVEMQSNVKTTVDYQGHGMIRATAFQLLRCIQEFINRNSDAPRATIFCFEEPEIFLHPAAANQMRDAIYELAEPNCQIIATTHSPYMVNLGSDASVSLCKFSLLETGGSSTTTLNLDSAFRTLQDDEKQNLKMLLKVDDYFSRVFFSPKSIFIEGDTEEVLVRESLRRLSVTERAKVVGNIEFIRARGKPVLISIAKYLNALGIEYHILHDHDGSKPGSESVNNAIADAAGEDRRTMVHEQVEDLLGYPPPSYDKPFKAHQFTEENWGDSFDSISENWRLLFLDLCAPHLDSIR